MIEFTFYSTKAEDYDANHGGCEVAKERVVNTEEGVGNENAVIEATKQANLPVGTYVAIQTASDQSGDIMGWGWLVEVAVPSTPQVRVLQ